MAAEGSGGARFWFNRWMDRHRNINRHDGWQNFRLDTQTGRDFFEGWIVEFDRQEVTEEEALQASRDIQVGGRTKYPEHHLPALLTAIRIRRDDRKPDHQAEASRARRAANTAIDRRDDRARPAWQAMPEEQKARWRESYTGMFPGLIRAPRFLELATFRLFAEEFEKKSGGQHAQV